MKIRLLANDSKIPNFAIMKISTYHKKNGDDVDWYNPILDMYDTDIFYESKVFTFSEEYQYYPTNAKIIRGGTGIDITGKLPEEIERITDLDYSLYPDCDYSIIFTTRGCIRHCPFCVVPIKEGLIHKTENTPNLNPKGKWIMLLDNNFFSYKDWRERLDILRNYNQLIDFNTGIDLRILTEEQAQELGKTKIKSIHCAWDNYEDKDVILPKIELLCKYVKPYKITTYVLVGFKNKSKILEEDIERVMTLKDLGVNPFACGFMDFNDPNFKKVQEVKDFCRWVNMKATFKSVEWKDYKKGG